MNADRLFVAGALALALSGAALAQPPRAADPLAGLAKAVTLATADSLTLVEDDHGVAHSRTLKVGDEYRDGWKLTALGGQTVTLAKGGQTRIVTLGSAAQPQAAGTEAALLAAERAALTNAVEGQRTRTAAQARAAGQPIQRPAQPADRARIQQAIASGSVEDVYALGGSAADIAQMLAPNGGPMADILAAGGQASFVNMNGRAGVQITSGGADGGPQRNLVMVPPQLSGVTPPTDAPTLTPPPISGTATFSSDGAGNNIIRRTIPGPAQ